MHDATGSGVFQPGRYLQDDAHRLGDGQPAALFQVNAQVDTLDKLKGDKVQALVLAAVKDPRDVFMIQPRGRSCFLVKALDVLVILGHFRRQNLESDEAVELRIASTQHRRHATDADGLE